MFLLAKTSDEFHKMVKVRAEMETLLKEIKDQVRKNSEGHDVSKTRNPESTTSSCVTDRNENERANVHLEDQVTSSSMEVVSYEKSSEDGCCMRLDVLEEEFHAELERLQVNYGPDIPSFLPEEEEHDTESLDEIADYRQGLNGGMGEVVEDEDDDDAEYNGVSPVELERRLHELLHQRNQERIEELESALRCAEKKLVEKEMVACLWKDTAKLALRQDNELQ